MNVARLVRPEIVDLQNRTRNTMPAFRGQFAQGNRDKGMDPEAHEK